MIWSHEEATGKNDRLKCPLQNQGGKSPHYNIHGFHHELVFHHEDGLRRFQAAHSSGVDQSWEGATGLTLGVGRDDEAAELGS